MLEKCWAESLKMYIFSFCYPAQKYHQQNCVQVFTKKHFNLFTAPRVLRPSMLEINKILKRRLLTHSYKYSPIIAHNKKKEAQNTEVELNARLPILCESNLVQWGTVFRDPHLGVHLLLISRGNPSVPAYMYSNSCN